MTDHPEIAEAGLPAIRQVAHPGPHSLLNLSALELRHRADVLEHEATCRRRPGQFVAPADEGNAQRLESCVEQVFQALTSKNLLRFEI
jgi:hypothetical protein